MRSKQLHSNRWGTQFDSISRPLSLRGLGGWLLHKMADSFKAKVQSNINFIPGSVRPVGSVSPFNILRHTFSSVRVNNLDLA